LFLKFGIFVSIRFFNSFAAAVSFCSAGAITSIAYSLYFFSVKLMFEGVFKNALKCILLFVLLWVIEGKNSYFEK
jgi:hypothetical protein